MWANKSYMSDSTTDHLYPGINRLNYFLAHLGIVAVSIVSAIYFGPGSPVFKILALLIMIASFVLDVMRLRNIGVSQWFAMLRLIPYISLLFAIGLQSAQTGWVESKRLDRAGMIIAAVHVALIALVIYIIFWGKMSIAYFGSA